MKREETSEKMLLRSMKSEKMTRTCGQTSKPAPPSSMEGLRLRRGVIFAAFDGLEFFSACRIDPPACRLPIGWLFIWRSVRVAEGVRCSSVERKACRAGCGVALFAVRGGARAALETRLSERIDERRGKEKQALI